MGDYGTLIDVEALATARQSAAGVGWVLLDCRFELLRPDWGAAQYAAGHIAGAQYAHLDRDLAGPIGPTTGRHPLPAPAAFEQCARRWGISAATQVVAYDQGNGMYAARAWWLLRWLGHERVAVLDGGIAAWLAAGHGLVTECSLPPAGDFSARPDPRRTLDAAGVAQSLAAGSVAVSDARGADRYAGQNESIDPVAGHVPGACNHPFTRNLGADGRFLPATELRARWLATLAGREPQAHVAMCGSGVSACHNLLALEHAGLPGSRLYPGSWSEWIRDPSRPIATGAG